MDLFHMPSAGEAMSALFVLLFCGLIGLEREVHRKDAGIRTHVLVGLGSYLFTLVSLYGAPSALTGNMRWNASRIATQVVSGIGFIGTKVIFRRYLADPSFSCGPLPNLLVGIRIITLQRDRKSVV